MEPPTGKTEKFFESKLSFETSERRSYASMNPEPEPYTLDALYCYASDRKVRHART